MSSVIEEPVSKRRRTERSDDNDDGSEQCLTFEMLLEADVAIDQIAERLTRLLEFEPGEGIREAVQLLLKSAGMFEYALDSKLQDATALVDELENAFDRMEWVSASSMPMNQRLYAANITELLSAVVPVLASADEGEVLALLVRYYSALAAMHMRPIRQAATWLLVIIALAHDEPATLGLGPVFRSRAGDVVPIVRQLAIEGLDAIGEHQQVSRALNDVNATVRLEALARVSSKDPVNVWARVHEIAMRDVDVKLRRKALRSICREEPISNDALDTGVQCLIAADIDDDAVSLAAAAELVTMAIIPEKSEPKFAKHNMPAPLEYTTHILQLPVRVLSSDECLKALCKAMMKIPRSRAGSLSLPKKPSDVGEILTFDFARILRSSADKQWKRNIEKLIVSHRMVLVKLFSALCSHVQTPAVVCETLSGVNGISSIWRVLSYNDELLAAAISSFGQLPITERNETFEEGVSTLLQDAMVYFEERPSRAIVESCASVFTEAMHFPALETELEHLVLTIKMALATALGPGARDAEDHPEEIAATVLQTQILAQFVPVDDMARLPIWSVPACAPIVRLLAFSKTESVRDGAVERMLSQTPRPVQAIVESYIVTKMRGDDISSALSTEDLSTLPDVTWRAAVAADVF